MLKQRKEEEKALRHGMIKTHVERHLEQLHSNESSKSNSQGSFPRLEDEFIYLGTPPVSIQPLQIKQQRECSQDRKERWIFFKKGNKCMRITHRANFTDTDFALTTCLMSEHFTLSGVSPYLADVTAAVWSCFPAAPVNSPSTTTSAQSVTARAQTLLGSLPGGLATSPILHTFTLLSMEPVATQGMMGDRATVVTYLQGEEEEQAGEGCAQQARTSSWERYQSDGWSQTSPSLNPVRHFKATRCCLPAALLQRRRHIASLHTVFLGNTNKGRGKIPTF